MQQYRFPIYRDVPQPIQNTIRDQNKFPIDLTNYHSVFLEVKLQGQLYITLPASFVSPPSSGQVQLSSYAFPEVGIWSLQFYVADLYDNRIYGEILQVTVVPNVEDLALTQLPTY
jgi:hypothetical protein